MACLGMNIVTVLHQPRYMVFSQFHEVLLLGRGGRTVFLGPVSAALPYFSSLGFELPPNENPADFFLDIISGIVPCKDDAAFRPVVRPLLHGRLAGRLGMLRPYPARCFFARCPASARVAVGESVQAQGVFVFSKMLARLPLYACLVSRHCTLRGGRLPS